jgi:Ca2+-binding EF-hand superfamily protein
LHALGATEEEAQAAFTHLDQDNNGTLSTDELAAAFFEYYSSSDPSAHGNYVFGSL